MIEYVGPYVNEVSEGGFKMNVRDVPVKRARDYAEEVFEKNGKSLDDELPLFDPLYSKLQAILKREALGIRRVDMPVIEPSDMKKFHKELNLGHIDILKPYAYGKLVTPTSLTLRDGDAWIHLGQQDGNDKDDILKAKWTTSTTSSLLPTQSEIWLEKLVGNIAKFGAPTQGSPITKATVIASKEGYILDGHHRYGQAMLANPKLKLKTLYVPLDIDTLLKVGRSFGNAVGNQQKA